MTQECQKCSEQAATIRELRSQLAVALRDRQECEADGCSNERLKKVARYCCNQCASRQWRKMNPGYHTQASRDWKAAQKEKTKCR